MEAFNLANFKGGQTNPKGSDGKYPERATPGGYLCTVTGLKNSSEIEGYTSSPFIEFYLLTEDGKQANARFWVVKQTDKDSTKEWKKKQLKDFLMNCGVTEFNSDAEACKSAVNRRVQVALVSEEYVGKDKETGTLVKRTAVKYLWSSKVGKKLTYNSKYNKVLSADDQQLLDGMDALKSKFDTEPVAPKSFTRPAAATLPEDTDLPF